MTGHAFVCSGFPPPASGSLLTSSAGCLLSLGRTVSAWRRQTLREAFAAAARGKGEEEQHDRADCGAAGCENGSEQREPLALHAHVERFLADVALTVRYGDSRTLLDGVSDILVGRVVGETEVLAGARALLATLCHADARGWGRGLKSH